jgi:hypothetical protein
MLLCLCCERRMAEDPQPCGCESDYCTRCLRCGKHCRCEGSMTLVDVDETEEEPMVVITER